MNYNYFRIPRLEYPEKNLKVLKQQILKNQSMANELKKLWEDKQNPAFINKTLDVMEKYFEKEVMDIKEQYHVEVVLVSLSSTLGTDSLDIASAIGDYRNL